MIRLSRSLILIGLLLVALHRPAQAACPLPFPNTPVNGVDIVDATLYLNNLNYLRNCAINVDNTQIGAGGIWPSQLIWTTGPQGILGGTNTFQVSPGVANVVPFIVKGAAAQSADILQVFTNDGTKQVWVDSAGAFHATGLTGCSGSCIDTSGSNQTKTGSFTAGNLFSNNLIEALGGICNPGGLTSNGDVIACRGSSSVPSAHYSGQFVLGQGSTTDGFANATIDFGRTSPLAMTLQTNQTANGGFPGMQFIMSGAVAQLSCPHCQDTLTHGFELQEPLASLTPNKWIQVDFSTGALFINNSAGTNPMVGFADGGNVGITGDLCAVGDNNLTPVFPNGAALCPTFVASQRGQLYSTTNNTGSGRVWFGNTGNGFLDYSGSAYTLNKAPLLVSTDGSTNSYVPPTYTATSGAVAATQHAVQGQCNFVATNKCTVTFSGTAAPFTNQGTYACSGSEVVADTGGSNAVSFENQSGTSTIIYLSVASSFNVAYYCVGT